MRLKLAIFDCDGTLVDSRAAILSTMDAAFAALGLAAPDHGLVRQIIGLSLDHAIAVLAPDHPPNTQIALVESYKRAAIVTSLNPISAERTFDGIDTVLDELESAGVLLAVATGRGRRALDESLAGPPLAGRFVATVSADDAASKPAPDMALKALRLTGVEAADAVVIGDTEYDIAMARHAGIAAIGVAWGHHPAERLLDAGAAIVVERPADLTGTVLGLLG
ncbi:MAG: HAD-IA family hydrolase [Rhodospirillaceae bacterium]|nr:HAD-IA family hydrolase [Rhodospirillaceae bacterium]